DKLVTGVQTCALPISLTGVEAISNGVPAFRKPKARNAATTLAMMGVLAVVLFAGVTVLGIALHARAQDSGTPSVIAQIAAAVFEIGRASCSERVGEEG